MIVYDHKFWSSWRTKVMIHSFKLFLKLLNEIKTEYVLVSVFFCPNLLHILIKMYSSLFILFLLVYHYSRGFIVSAGILQGNDNLNRRITIVLRIWWRWRQEWSWRDTVRYHRWWDIWSEKRCGNSFWYWSCCRRPVDHWVWIAYVAFATIHGIWTWEYFD